jgi:hypothetical protein
MNGHVPGNKILTQFWTLQFGSHLTNVYHEMIIVYLNPLKNHECDTLGRNNQG